MGRMGVRMPPLTPQEIAYLLGKSSRNLNEQAVPAVVMQAFDLLERLLPLRFTSYAVLFLFFTILPMLGFRGMLSLIGQDRSLLVGVLTALVGIFIISRNANSFLRQAADKVHNAEKIPVEVLQQGVISGAGILLMLPGPVVNFLALGLLYPPVTRLVSLSLYRYIQRQKA